MATPKKKTKKILAPSKQVKNKPRTENKKGLNPKQETFAQEYVKDLNAKQAAIRAGYSEKSAEVNGCRLLSHAKVQHRVQELMDDRSQRTQITADVILTELLALATVDVTQAYDDKGAIKNIHDMPENLRKAISSVDVIKTDSPSGKTTFQNLKVRFYDKTKSLELLGKHLRLFAEVIEPGKGLNDGNVKFVAEWGSAVETTPDNTKKS